MTRRDVLVVEDAPDAQELVVGLLRNAGYEVATATDGTSALRAMRSRPPDLVLLDLGLPDMDGLDVCKRMREMSDVPVLMLTARENEFDTVLGLKLGADDYVTKPFRPHELLARCEAILRRHAERTSAPSDRERTIGDLVVRPASRQVLVDGEEVELTRIEFDLLDALTEDPTHVRSRAVLLERVWGPDWFGDDHVIEVHIANLRRKIDRPSGPSRIRTVRGVGYRMAEA